MGKLIERGGRYVVLAFEDYRSEWMKIEADL